VTGDGISFRLVEIPFPQCPITPTSEVAGGFGFLGCPYEGNDNKYFGNLLGHRLWLSSCVVTFFVIVEW
jgi:hypothetical protein